MSAREFQITLFLSGERTERKIVAHSSIQALQTALRTVEDDGLQVAVICKPARADACSEMLKGLT